MTTGTDLAKRFFTNNGATYDRIANLSTLGLDILWKRKILAKIPPGSTCILDQACGTGVLTFKIARRFPGARVIGVELCGEYLDIARAKARALGITNCEFRLGRAEDIVVDAPVDAITSSYLAKYAELDRLVANAKMMLRPGGVLVMHELTRPVSPVYAALWQFDFQFIRACIAWRYPEWDMPLRELQPLVKESRWQDELAAALAANSFSRITTDVLFIQSSALVCAVK